METKQCSKCKEIKIVSEFFLNKGQPRNSCKVCTKAQNDAWYQRNKKQVCQRTGSYYRDNKEKYTEYQRAWRVKNPEAGRETTQRYRNKDRVAYRREDLIRVAARRAAKIQRTPKWADLDKIAEIYRKCPEGYVVDHIIPLRGKVVSGLHVESNLQYLTHSENCRKSNKFPYAESSTTNMPNTQSE